MPHLPLASAACSDPADRMPCAVCALGPLCMPRQPGVEAAPVRLTRRRLQRRDVLFRRGQPFRALYVPRTGFFKTHVIGGDGRSQVVDFQMAGDLLGMDGIVDGVHQCEAVALEDAEVCVVEFQDATEMCMRLGEVGMAFQRTMARELERQQRAVFRLRCVGESDHRLARFLMEWSARQRRLGMPAQEFVLRMTREDIGSLLGLTLETVCRALTRMKRQGLLEVACRYIAIRQTAALAQLASGDLPPLRGSGPATAQA